MSFSRAGLLACLLFALVSCSRRAENAGPERIAILRFENLSADPSLDWMGRAFSEIIVRELAAAPGMYAIPADRLHRSDAALGIRPIAAPGISAERSLALAGGANRLAYGEYWVRGGRVEARLTVEDPRTSQMIGVFSASASNPVDAAGELARQISNRAAPSLTHNLTALRAYISGLESTDLAMRAQQAEMAISADPNFSSAYSLLAEARLQQRDRAGAQAVLDQALAHAPAMPELERARLIYEAANLRGDSPGAERSLSAWARVAPNDPAVWTAIAQASMTHHDYAQAVQAYQKAVTIQPEDINLLNQLGYAAAYAGDLNTATQSLLKYQMLRPADPNPIDSLGDVNLVLGRLREAENFYLQAAKKNPAFLNGGDFFKAAMTRLMSGDPGGADKLNQQFLAARATAKDPLVDFYKAQWMWISGRRKEAVNQLAACARSTETGPLRQVASEAYGQLAVWQITLGHRGEAGPMAEKAAQLAGPSSASLAAIARFLAQPSAPPEEWAARAERSFPSPAERPVRNVALAYALLADQHYQAAAQALKSLYDATSPTADDSLPVLLGWAYLESGKPKEAAALLRFNPIPSATVLKPFLVFDFPRLFYLRGRGAEMAGSRDQAAAQFRIFRQLSGDTPLAWGEETWAK